MLPALLITFREILEAALIVATIIGMLVRLKKHKSIKTVWSATFSAFALSILLLLGASIIGLNIQEFYTGKVEEFVEGVLFIASAFFITWAVFWLHTYFARHKLALLQKVNETIEKQGSRALFMLVFTAVFREGFEIVLFLSTIYLSSTPVQILTGFSLGALAGLFIAFLFFTASLRFPVYRAFQFSTLLLILFAGGMLMRGVHEFVEIGMLPETSKIYLNLIPAKGTFIGDVIKSLFGWTRNMENLQLFSYLGYLVVMRYYLLKTGSTVAES